MHVKHATLHTNILLGDEPRGSKHVGDNINLKLNIFRLLILQFITPLTTAEHWYP